ncbi:hypothetical protein TVAG_140210 [Trichomonas vaginalis G3]|uniref:Uncharacterized protein n=1 Tax=Trichomonas vaginalis (strain ATCC PRA-98 / G3) TaxID=412133 RepID=A2F6G4_TRIV3|nr:protein ubiquitination [Trichomonas vaginalis G3]EAX99522.1 hypothetical protein TVAG_140210 [Trichomonas vaginalis G3]KAI5535670.1 protein ubiquitination [Trichomonas vaginalis G3]|eukprot:XP_001312452.1 hypothetical protein [Trichomonas vaginalis G3]
MSDLTVDFDYIANNIQTYIVQEKFFDIVDKDDIPQVLEKVKLNTHDFNALLSQGKSKYSTSELFSFIRKCDVSINSFEDAINVLKCYKKNFKLESSRSLINYLKENKTKINLDSEEVTQLKSEIQTLKSKIATMENEINQYKSERQQYKDEISALNSKNNQLVTQLAKQYDFPLNSNDFNAVYNFLKGLSDKDDKLKMSISCAVGLSEKRDLYECTPLIQACMMGDFQFTKSLIEGGCDRNAISKLGNNCLVVASLK